MSEIIEPPETPLKRDCTPAQIDFLKRVVATNGGGLSVYRAPVSIINGLIKRHLIQGKRGCQSVIVHTREGLELIRSLKDA